MGTREGIDPKNMDTQVKPHFMDDHQLVCISELSNYYRPLK